jgi:hypothetical protein
MRRILFYYPRFRAKADKESLADIQGQRNLKPHKGPARRFELAGRTPVHTVMKRQFQFFLLTGWLIPVALALLSFGRWITDIVVPTLKGGSFDQLYDLHRFRYLDTTLTCIAIAFIWATLAVFRWARRHIHAV